MKAGIVITLAAIEEAQKSGLNRPSIPFDETMKATFEKAESIAAPLGIPVLDGLGAIGEGYHSEREYIFAESLAERMRLVATLLKNW